MRVIDKLAERGLVEKDRARQDARAQSLKLSKAGKRAARSSCTKRATRSLTICSPASPPAQRAALEQAIRAILHRCVDPGREGDVTCRVCDDRRCSPEICPIRVV